MKVKKSIELQQAAMKKKINASKTDAVRHEFDLQEARLMEQQAGALMALEEPIELGAGGEIVPMRSMGLVGLESALKEPDRLDMEVSIQRTELADQAGCFESAIQTAESAKAKGAIQQMLSHQLAAAHRHSMRLLGESEKVRDPAISLKMINAATRLMEAYAKSAVALQRLQTGANQVVQVQHVQVVGQAVIGNIRGAL